MDQPTPHPAPTGPEAPPVTCAHCGARQPDGAPPTWTCSMENGSRQYLCHDCARAHIRSIEGKLDPTWW
ncbi:hypothetical protein [Streptomyces sp. G-G2]|uniref:hypothetical protein n=1 Tax=Streptomyces sp. G-G2 TaxID=3046201 RepID=UPI0024BB212A|nr:hypothetical protein [Streptomyces sp. G-G2]MDJ0384392.1 hypothetical protein [Streptomyces sp. G-G2]